MEYTLDDICAVVITYNCDESIQNNITSLLSQVDRLIIVDNNSNEKSKNLINQFTLNPKISFVYNNDNFGIAYALNQGYQRTLEYGYNLLLTMDQDSLITDGAVQKMLDVINKTDEISSVGPTLITAAHYKKDINENSDYSEAKYLISSGNLTKVSVIEEIGGYDEKLFIDSVDFDFSLRIRENGYKLAIVNNAHMVHEIGDTFEKRILFRTVKLSNHSPLRYYYMYRNNHYIIKKYIKKFPVFCTKKIIFSIIHFGELMFHTKRIEKYKMIFKGIADAFKDNYGKLQN